MRLLHNLKGRGYSIHLFYLWVRSIDIALGRIAGRVRRGGHNVPEEDVRRRFKRSSANLFKLYRPIVDSLIVFDNSTATPNMIFYEKSGVLEIVNSELFSFLSRNVEAI